jgi:hypothetical protein
MVLMLCCSFAKNYDVIKENQDEFPEKGCKHVVHQVLKGGWSIAQAKMHDQIFIMA